MTKFGAQLPNFSGFDPVDLFEHIAGLATTAEDAGFDSVWGGEKRTLRLVAPYADKCNVIGDVGTLARKISVLRRHCAEVGRDPAEVGVTWMTR